MASHGGFNFVKTYQELPPELFSNSKAALANSPELVLFNKDLANSLELDIDQLNSQLGAEIFSGNETIPNSNPIALAYAGHQFGGFNILGDGRALLLGEHQLSNGKLVDIQLKGSGPSRYSRGGDGLATFKAMLKEYLYSEAMHGLRIPTTRSLALVKTSDQVRRERMHQRAVVTRVASSHIRVGTFELAIRSNADTLRKLADYVINRHYPELNQLEDKYLLLLRKVIDKQAHLVAQWMGVGFVHGVLNTDNVSIAGETIDFGPCAFMDNYNTATVFSSIDTYGRYAYGSQAQITLWNLCRFAECLIPLIDPTNQELAIEKVENELHQYLEKYQSNWDVIFSKKIGFENSSDDSIRLAKEFLNLLEKNNLDFTYSFRQLALGTLNKQCLAPWLKDWQSTQAKLGGRFEDSQKLMKESNPAIIPRNHIIEELINQVDSTNELSELLKTIEVLKTPYSDLYNRHSLALPRPEGIAPTVTYCGT